MKKTRYYTESKDERAERIRMEKQPPKLKFPITPLFVKTDTFTARQFLVRFMAWMQHNNDSCNFVGWVSDNFAEICEPYLLHLYDNGCLYPINSSKFLMKYDTKEIPDFKHDF